MPKRILLADDSITIQKVVELTFSDGDYEVIAVNNGAKAIQKLSEIRPDIVLSDIIMPEKNGYEVCEYVKSHPDYRTIPVVLLTGTFEPFDPDRADKAGCDAVVTKPFESQSLIHKVEDLIQQSQPAAPAAPAAPAEGPWAAPAEAAPFGGAPEGDVFGSQPAAPSTDMPFETAGAEAFSGETRSFQRMSFEDLQRLAGQPAAVPPPAPAPAAEAAPWEEQSAPLPPVRMPEVSPWEEEQPAAAAPQEAAAPPAAPEPQAAPWEEPPAFSGETRAFQRLSFDDLQKMATGEPAAATPPAAPPPAPAPEPESIPWEQPEPGLGETRAMPRMSFEELQRLAAASAPPAPPAEEPRADSSLWEEPAAPAMETAAPFEEPAAPQPPAFEPSAAEEAPKLEGEPPMSVVSPEPEAGRAAAAPAAASGQVELTQEQIDQIARRVVEMLSADIVRNIAWEVIPDMAEMVVKDRIRQLESEA